jgi:cell division protein FtsQ
MIAESWLGRRQRRRPLARARSVVRQRPRVVLVVVALVILLGGAWLWLRDSSLVAVQRVSVTGESGPDAAQIHSALVAAARNMTTLDVRMDRLRTAVAPYPVVKDLRVSTQFPHGMRIRVVEQIPVGAIVVGGRTIAVAADGTLLHDVVPSASLPMIPLRVPPGGPRLSEGALQALAVLGAAPFQLLARISQVTTVASHGLVAQLRNGPSIYFGDPTRLAAKWIAATAVLVDSGSAGALYIDVTDPERPAAGAAGASATTGSGSGTSATTGSGTGTSATGTSGTGTSATGTSATGTSTTPTGG